MLMKKGNTIEQELLNYHFNNVHITINEKMRLLLFGSKGRPF